MLWFRLTRWPWLTPYNSRLVWWNYKCPWRRSLLRLLRLLRPRWLSFLIEVLWTAKRTLTLMYGRRSLTKLVGQPCSSATEDTKLSFTWWLPLKVLKNSILERIMRQDMSRWKKRVSSTKSWLTPGSDIPTSPSSRTRRRASRLRSTIAKRRCSHLLVSPSMLAVSESTYWQQINLITSLNYLKELRENTLNLRKLSFGRPSANRTPSAS